MRRLLSFFLAGAVVFTSFTNAAADYISPEYLMQFDSYTDFPGGDKVLPETATFSNSDTNAVYDYYSVMTERGRGMEFSFTKSEKNSSAYLTPAKALEANPAYSFEISILRKDVNSDLTVSLLSNNAGNKYLNAVFGMDKKVSILDTPIPDFTYNIDEWVDFKLTLNPDKNILTAYIFQKDSYGELTLDYSGQTDFVNGKKILRMRTLTKSGTYTPETRYVIDDVRMYSSAATLTDDEGLFEFAAANPAQGRKWLPTDTSLRLVFTQPVDISESTWKLNDEALSAERISVDGKNSKMIVIDTNGLLSIGDNVNVSWENVKSTAGRTHSGSTSFFVSSETRLAADTVTKIDSESKNCTFFVGGVSYDGVSEGIALASEYGGNGAALVKETYNAPFTKKFSSTEKSITLSDISDSAELYYMDNLYELNHRTKPCLITGEAFTAEKYSGSEKFSALVDYEDGSINIAGKPDNPGEYMTLAVLKPDVSVSEFKTAENTTPGSGKDMLCYLRCIRYEDSFSFSFNPNIENGGKMSMLVNYHDGNGVREYPGQLTYLTTLEKESGIADFNADDADYSTLIPLWGSRLDLNVIIYNSIGETAEEKTAAKNAINAQLKAARPYSLISDIQREYNKAVLLQRINYSANGEAVVNLIEANYSLINQEAKVYKLYTDNKTDIFTDVCAKMNADFNSLQDVSDAFYDAIISSMLKISKGYAAVEKVLSEGRTYLETRSWDFTKFDDLEDPKDVYLALVGCTDEDIKTKFSGAVDARYEKENFVTEQEPEDTEDEQTDINITIQTPSGNGGGGGGGNKKPAETEPMQPEETTKPDEPAVIFKDLDNVQWAKEAVNALAERGVLNGKAEGVFAPGDNMLREEAVKLIVLAFLDNTDSREELTFEDILPDAWYTPYISAAVENKVINGISDSMFGTGLNVTRQDFAVMCVKASGIRGNLSETERVDLFTDYELTSDYAKEAVAVLKKLDIINGRTDGSFCPMDTITRAEAAKIVYGLMQMKGGTK